MSKPKTQSVPNPDQTRSSAQRRSGNNGQPNEPLSGSKKVKNRNHVDHHNPQG